VDEGYLRKSPVRSRFSPTQPGAELKAKTGATGMAERQYLVKMERISKSFGAVRAVREVDLEIYPAEILGLVGDNAAGKSTLMKILCGALIPDSGRILFEGKEVHFTSPLDARRLGIEMIYQDLSLCGNLSVWANLFIGREITKSYLGGLVRLLDKRKMEQESRQMLDIVKVDMDSVKRKVERLSGGQQQAVAIARAVGFAPKLLLMDEPTANLSVKAARQVLDLIKELRARGIAIVLVSHRIEDIAEVGDRVIVLKGGQKVGERKISDTTMSEITHMIIWGRAPDNFQKIAATANS